MERKIKRYKDETLTSFNNQKSLDEIFNVKSKSAENHF